MRRERDETFKVLVQGIGEALPASSGWRQDEAESVVNSRRFVRDLDGPLCLTLDAFFHTGDETGRHVFWAVVAVRCPAAQHLLEGLGSPATAAIERDLAMAAGGDAELRVVLSPALDVSDTVGALTRLLREADAALTGEAGSVDGFLRCVAVDDDRVDEVGEVVAAVLAVSGRADEARAALARLDDRPGAAFVQGLTGWLDGARPGINPGKAESFELGRATWDVARARVQTRREALAIMERLGPDADVDVRRAALTAALAARGVDETPYWIERHACHGGPEGGAGLMRVARDAVHVFRAIHRDAARDGGDTASLGRGPWLRVALNSEAHATVTHAYNNASIRIGDLAAVTVVLRPGDAGARTTVALDGIEVGQLDADARPPEQGTVGAQIGRLAGPGLYVMQLRLP